MSRDINRILTDMFPDATYCATGLDAGKWITDKYKFHLKCGFYTLTSTGRSVFVNGKDGWEKVLKELSEQNKEVNAIVKG